MVGGFHMVGGGSSVWLRQLVGEQQQPSIPRVAVPWTLDSHTSFAIVTLLISL